MAFSARAAASALVTCMAMQAGEAQNVSTFQFRFTQSHGPHAVGIKVVEQYDRSRSFRPEGDFPSKSKADDGPRPLQTLVWYPAEGTTRSTMTFGDYGG
jgi:hypothetical protein